MRIRMSLTVLSLKMGLMILMRMMMVLRLEQLRIANLMTVGDI